MLLSIFVFSSKSDLCIRSIFFASHWRLILKFDCASCFHSLGILVPCGLLWFPAECWLLLVAMRAIFYKISDDLETKSRIIFDWMVKNVQDLAIKSRGTVIWQKNILVSEKVKLPHFNVKAITPFPNVKQKRESSGTVFSQKTAMVKHCLAN